ncbi:MAG: hypothetical protein ACYTG4_09800 [Planctomycetota bacterium]|jgi:hypothetical protein
MSTRALLALLLCLSCVSPEGRAAPDTPDLSVISVRLKVGPERNGRQRGRLRLEADLLRSSSDSYAPHSDRIAVEVGGTTLVDGVASPDARVRLDRTGTWRMKMKDQAGPRSRLKCRFDEVSGMLVVDARLPDVSSPLTDVASVPVRVVVGDREYRSDVVLAKKGRRSWQYRMAGPVYDPPTGTGGGGGGGTGGDPVPAEFQWSTLEQGAGTGIAASPAVIRDSASWAVFYGTHKFGVQPPAIDFTREMVLVLYGNFGHQKVDIFSVVPDGNGLTVRGTFYPAAVQKMVSPYHLVRCSRRNGGVQWMTSTAPLPQ